MNDSELIAEQTREIARLKRNLRRAHTALTNIKMIMVCIPGPLNGNKLGFTATQRRVFHRIDQEVDDGLAAETLPE